MNVISLGAPENDFESIIAQVLSDAEPVVLDVGSGDRVVVMPLDDFSAWQETAYLLKSPANAAHLSKSISEAQAGKVTPHALDE